VDTAGSGCAFWRREKSFATAGSEPRILQSVTLALVTWRKKIISTTKRNFFFHIARNLLKIFLGGEAYLNCKVLVFVNRLIKAWWQHHPIRSAIRSAGSLCADLNI